MNIYVESSALLSWLFRERGTGDIEGFIDGAVTLVTSDLTLIECHRAIHRRTALRQLSSAAATRMSSDLALEAASWVVLEFSAPVVERASQPFVDEPIRTLDALHVAFALRARAEHAHVALLSLDDRIRRVGKSAGLDILPLDP
jgi:predicted nucleic acid-binding protein